MRYVSKFYRWKAYGVLYLVVCLDFFIGFLFWVLVLREGLFSVIVVMLGSILCLLVVLVSVRIR